MNLLMLILIFLALWICGAIAYFAWTLTAGVPESDESDDTQESLASPDSKGPAK
jgi:hypothetical protein